MINFIKIKTLCLISISLIFCRQQENYYFTQGRIFKTSAHFKYKFHRDLGKEIFARLDSFDLSLNPFNPQSIIYKVNHNEEVEIDDWFITVFNKAQEISELTGGAYDITSAPLINLWGFGYEKIGQATPSIVDSLKQFVGYRKVRIEGRKVIKDDTRLQLNASSIAKGYACDIIAQLFDSYGITDYMIEIGGEIHVKGKNPSGKLWSIEILKPVEDSTGIKQECQQLVFLENKSLATSGNYRNFYIKDGKKYAHTINPLTGYPAEENILSSSVIYPDCMTADAFATAFMVLGLEKSCALADKIPEMDYLFIYANDEKGFSEKRSRNFDRYKNPENTFVNE
jgi:thiamine biosynthesis lipoprotein